MINGLLSKSSSIVVMPFGPKTGLGAITPLYIHCIRLQADIEIITNKTTRALNLLAKQNTKMGNVIYQNCLALDNLLTFEGGVCEKFNLNNSCLQINDKEKS
jgi:hypothetical protein